jgi:hypothetical protein
MMTTEPPKMPLFAKSGHPDPSGFARLYLPKLGSDTVVLR